MISRLVLPSEPLGGIRAVFRDGAVLDGGKVVFSGTSAATLEPSATVRRKTYRFDRTGATVDFKWFSKPAVVRSESAYPRVGLMVRQQVEIPMWLVVAGYLVAWGGALLWRRRRWRRWASAGADANASAGASMELG